MIKNLNRNLLCTAAAIVALGMASPAVYSGTDKPVDEQTGATEKPESGDGMDEYGSQNGAAPETPADQAQDESTGDDAAEEPADQAQDGTADDGAEGDDMAATEGAPVDGQIIWQDADTFLVSSLIGATVYTPDDESIGDINDVLAMNSGEIEGVVIGVGGFLGLGEKEVAIQYDRIEVISFEGGMRLVLDATTEELEAAPEFQTVEAQRLEEEMRQLYQEQPDDVTPLPDPLEGHDDMPSDGTDRAVE